MATRVRVALACEACGQRVGQWVGRCPSCGAWGSITDAPAAPRDRADVRDLIGDEEPDRRLSTGSPGFDRVLGGGLVPGSVALIAGEPGVGKSTFLLQVAAGVARAEMTCLYASGEESRAQVAARARRLALGDLAPRFVPGRDLTEVLEAARAERPDLLVVDSIQALRDPEQTTLPGGPSQVRACTDALVSLAKRDGIAVVLAGQVTKDGDLAGPRTLEHAVDVVCSFDGDPRTGLRVLAGGKNRFGPEGEVAWMEMGPAGLTEVDPATVLGRSAEPGAAAAVVVMGRRGLAVEIQALVVPGDGPSRRHVSGLDPRRFAVVAAVVDRVQGLRLAKAELYGASAGGLRIEEPGADLAVAAALASAATGTAAPPDSAFVGEVALTGEVRPVPNPAARVAAAGAAGIRTLYCGGDPGPVPKGIRTVRVAHVRDAIAWSRGRPAGAPVAHSGP